MDEEEIDRAVLAYLKKKGFKDVERMLLEEQSQNASTTQTDPEVAKQILSFSQLDKGPLQYQDDYNKLRRWAFGSLDLYKHELLHILYPVFIHCFLDLVAQGHTQEARTFFCTFREDHETMHLRDLQKLEGILTPAHLEEMEFARALRKSKVSIKMCEYSYELLLQYLQKTQSVVMLGVVNEHINFKVFPGQPSSIYDDVDVISLFGNSQDSAQEVNRKEVRWGLLEDSIEDRLERGVLPLEPDKVEGDNKDTETEETKKKLLDGGKQGLPTKKLKKDKLVSATGKNVRSEASMVSVAPRVKSELPLPTMSSELEQSILDDIRNRVQLSSLALPSICFYTFINTHNDLNCSSISQDGSLVAGGFSDSSLKVWDMSKIENESSANNSVELDGQRRHYTLFNGHAGPVYSVAFSPRGDYILSSSSDSTIRLWSTNLNSNLVCYKGHNYPVWDVQFSPVGHYFASTSHDRTARIWSMDRIQPLRIMAGHLSDVDCVQWHANCNYIATGSSDKTVRLWDVQSGECVRIFIGHRSMVLCLSMSPDGRFMASADEDGTIMIWDLSTGRCISPLLGHTSCVWSLAFSCEGTLLASGSADSAVKLWDVSGSAKAIRTEENKTGSANRLRLLKTLPTKSTPVYTLRFSRRNLLFAAGSLMKAV